MNFHAIGLVLNPLVNARFSWSALLALALGCATQAQAARPLNTDDARIVDPKSCQVESWVRRNQGSTEYWALPGCNFTGNLEVTAGGARTNDAAGSPLSRTLLQGKTIFKPLEKNGWGMGLAAGTVRRVQGSASDRDLYAYLPTSFSFADDRWVVHTNVGWLREQPTPARPWAWLTWRWRCGVNTSSTAHTTRTGLTVTGLCCPTATARC